MPCYSPLDAFRLPKKTESGKRQVVFGRDRLVAYDVAQKLTLPCGQCIGCRLERSRQWALRIVKELKDHKHASFLTLTYADKHLPLTSAGLPTLNLEDIQLFMKRLRKSRGYTKLRFFQCGEYGEKHGRPHHHMILFGEDFASTRSRIKDSQSGLPQWEAQDLTDLWGKGDCTIGEVTFESAAYVARYCLKKMTGDKAEAHYAGRKPEYITMSRRPGIGAAHFNKFLSDIYPADHCVTDDGRASLPPKFFDKLLEKADPLLYERVKRERRPDLGFDENPDTTSSRLIARRTVKTELIKSALKRGIE